MFQVERERGPEKGSRGEGAGGGEEDGEEEGEDEEEDDEEERQAETEDGGRGLREEREEREAKEKMRSMWVWKSHCLVKMFVVIMLGKSSRVLKATACALLWSGVIVAGNCPTEVS